MKMNKSWSVPVASFVLATTLALIAGPKPGAIAREEGGGTGPVVVCNADVFNLDGNTVISKNKISAAVNIDFLHGITATGTNNTVGARCFAALKYKVRMHNGTEVVRPIDVELKSTGFWQKTETDVVTTKQIPFTFTLNEGQIKKAIRDALLGEGETNLGEDQSGRSPMVLKFSFRGYTGKLNGANPNCENTLVHTVSTPVNEAGAGSAEVKKAD